MKKTEHYKEKLERERDIVTGELKEVGIIKNTKNPDDWESTSGDLDIQEADSNEVGDKLEAIEENAGLVSELETRLLEIDTALEKIQKGTYGMCEVDNKPIEEDRLEANPAAKTCKAHMN